MSRVIRNFAEMLGLLNRGKFADKLNEHLTNALDTLEALPGEKGTAKITTELTINYEGGRLDIKPSVKSKLPEEKAFSSTPFWAYEGGLSVQHPSQMDIFGGPRDAADRDEERETARA